MKKFICGIAALMVIALITGCPTEPTKETTYILDGTISADTGDVDLTQVSIQLIQNGNPKFKPVYPASDGSFEIHGVPAGKGFMVRATLDGFTPAETKVFNVPEEGAGLTLQLKKLKMVANISGSVTVDEDNIDLRSVDVILCFMEIELKRMHPDIDGTYVFTGIEQKAGANYKVAAELAGFDTATSPLFALTGDYDVPVLAVKGIPPEVTGCDFVEADKLIITFNGPVEVLNIEGFELVADFGPVSIESYQMNGDYELELNIDHPINLLEKVNVRYYNTKQSLRQKGTERYLYGFAKWADKSFAAEKPLIIDSFSVGNPLPNGLTIIWSKNIDSDSFNIMQGWTISSTGGPIDFMMTAINNGQMALVFLTSTPAKGDVLTLTYDDTVGSVKAAGDNAKLASFTATYTVQ